MIWKNLPNTETALEADNLNRIEQGLNTVDNRVVEFDSSKANQTDMLQTIRNITYNESTGAFTVTRFNGTSFTIDTDLEKLAVNFDYDDNPSSPHYQNLVITLEDGTVKYVDMSALITQYEFTNSAFISFSVTAGKVSATIIDGSITLAKLDPTILATIQSAVDNAEGFADEAEAWAKGTKNGQAVPATDPAYNNNSKYFAEESEDHAENSEAWAVGQRGGVDVPASDPTKDNNSKYHSEQAAVQAVNSEAWATGKRNGVDVPDTDPTYHKSSEYFAGQSDLSAQEAEGFKDDASAIFTQIQALISAVVFTVNFLTGELEYNPTTTYDFAINTTTGNLEWEVI